MEFETYKSGDGLLRGCKFSDGAKTDAETPMYASAMGKRPDRIWIAAAAGSESQQMQRLKPHPIAKQVHRKAPTHDSKPQRFDKSKSYGALLSPPLEYGPPTSQ
jgi:hypothetical protein